jgi:hypothetical protein
VRDVYFYHRPPYLHRGYQSRLLYLDYDGVLHPELVWRTRKNGIHLAPGLERHSLFENADLLVQALQPYPDARIILSTSWVRVLGFNQAAQRLSKPLRQRVIGATFHTAMPRDWFLSLPRYQQILRDVERRSPTAWLAIDDDLSDLPRPPRRNFVVSDPLLGISAPAVIENLVEALQDVFGKDESQRA